MKPLHIFCFCLTVLASTWAEDIGSVVNPRGARPVEAGYKSEECTTEKSWPFCSDDDWGPKCPSGCRIQGLLDEADHSLLKKIEKIRKMLDQNKAKHRSADQDSKQTYDYLKEKLINTAGNDNKYYEVSESLRQRIVDIKIKIDRQLRILNALKARVRDQVIEMQRLEVDIDIKLRSCKGSCKIYTEFSVDKESYVTLEKQIDQLEAQSVQSVETVGPLHLLKSRPLKDVVVDSKYKSLISSEQRQQFFPDVQTMQLVLEAEGSSASSAASVGKASGTTKFVPATSGTSSSSSSWTVTGSKDASKKGITEMSGGEVGKGSMDFFEGMGGLGGGLGGLGGGDFDATGRVTTQTLSCTKVLRKTTTHTKDGPVEHIEETMTGPGCDAQKAGGMSESSSSSSSSSFTKTTGGGRTDSLLNSKFGDGTGTSFSSSFTKMTSTKGGGSLLTSTKSGGGDFGGDPFGMDLGAFARENFEDDVPDFHARSVKSSVRSERQADYVGKDCTDIQRNHLTGEKSSLYKIKPSASLSPSTRAGEEIVEVYCDQEGLLAGWTLVQQRQHGGVSFNRSWAEYQQGFGRVDAQGNGEVWLGLKHLHLLTQEESMLRVELEDWEGGVATAEYTVRVGSEAEGYRLTIADYMGDAGDALVKGESSSGGQGFLSHAGMKFSTYDKDNDRWEESCAEMYGGGWWYNNCQSANLNGVYYKGGKYDPGSNVPYEIENGVVWLTYRPADYSLKTTRMKIRPLAMV
ncbi:fibrinogen alpha chain [Esox lucius]|uniref:Fibrinogen C-terminal domain-containing protein n=1 Tax=Esox lucius TaxID=8010 RepID=A0AAY5L3Y4_ESOLU|nr:fibrinogen alpha chain [Esox lucius]